MLDGGRDKRGVGGGGAAPATTAALGSDCWREKCARTWAAACCAACWARRCALENAWVAGSSFDGSESVAAAE